MESKVGGLEGWMDEIFEFTEDIPPVLRQRVSRDLFLIPAARHLCPQGLTTPPAIVIIGPQGIGKSGMLAAMFPPGICRQAFFTDGLDFRLGEKDISDLMRGIMVAECGEAKGLQKGDENRIKNFLTRAYDAPVRLAYLSLIHI